MWLSGLGASTQMGPTILQTFNSLVVTIYKISQISSFFKLKDEVLHVIKKMVEKPNETSNGYGRLAEPSRLKLLANAKCMISEIMIFWPYFSNGLIFRDIRILCFFTIISIILHLIAFIKMYKKFLAIKFGH